MKARTLVYLGFALSAKLSRPDEASHVAELAAAVVERTPGEVVTHARALQLASFIADGRGRYAEATAASERSVALLEAAYGPDDFRLSVPLENLGRALQYEGKMSEARDRIVRAAAILASTVGARHPLYAKAQYSLALLAMGTNDPAGALAAAQRAPRRVPGEPARLGRSRRRRGDPRAAPPRQGELRAGARARRARGAEHRIAAAS